MGRCLVKIPPSVNGTCKLITHFNYSFSNRHSFLEDRSMLLNVSAMALDAYQSCPKILIVSAIVLNVSAIMCHHFDCRNDYCNAQFYSTLTSRIMHSLRNLRRSFVCVLFVRMSLRFVSPASLNINAMPEATLSLQVW